MKPIFEGRLMCPEVKHCRVISQLDYMFQTPKIRKLPPYLVQINNEWTVLDDPSDRSVCGDIHVNILKYIARFRNLQKSSEGCY